VVLLGSAPLLVQRGLTESLTGRFELIRVPHWSFAEMRAAFGWDLDRYVYHGGYPGAAALVDDHERWVNYILDSLVETTISRDVLLLSRVDKPALLRQLFRLGCDYSGQILSYQKMLGELQDAGNTVTLAHYLELLASAGLIVGLQKFAGARVRQRGSSPKLLVRNTALMSAFLGLSQAEARRAPEIWGRLVESAVGAHLCNSAASAATEIFYWRDRGKEVDYVVRSGRSLAAFEVKSGARRSTPSGLAEFAKAFHPDRTLLVGTDGIPLAEFLAEPVESWL
jgi:predicted AAA+ superfamily ATPase